jgi:hypothetical protein
MHAVKIGQIIEVGGHCHPLACQCLSHNATVTAAVGIGSTDCGAGWDSEAHACKANCQGSIIAFGQLIANEAVVAIGQVVVVTRGCWLIL